MSGLNSRLALEVLVFVFDQLDVQRQALEFFDKNVEGFGQTRLEQCSPLTIASYMRLRPVTSSDFTVRNS